MSQVAAIVAMNKQRVIGSEGKLPWHIPEDMKHFKSLTSGCPVIMGRKTYESLPPSFRPLPGRRNIVVSRHPENLKSNDIEVVTSPEEAVKLCLDDMKGFSEPIWIIGGAEIYKASQPLWDTVYLTLVDNDFSGDAYFPEFEGNFDLVENNVLSGLSFRKYERI